METMFCLARQLIDATSHCWLPVSSHGEPTLCSRHGMRCEFERASGGAAACGVLGKFCLCRSATHGWRLRCADKTARAA